ncbi:Pre-mRNA-splicing factor cwf14 [Ceratocystis lukuohia]|uniref:Pre-mRNA-splicing factor cwf14 n=1 Tax=Ceratocystis lukuohia TaxID=2019550 RepID=A0ABR4MEE5_9PEZI
MPPIRSTKRKAPPEGFSDIESDLLIFQNKMKDAQNKPTATGPKHQGQWEIFQISHQRSRYVYDLYYEKEAISRKLYDWLLKNGYADAMLIAKWKKQGYEKLTMFATIVMLSAMRTNQGNQFQLNMYLPSASRTVEGRSRSPMCQLWMSRLCI